MKQTTFFILALCLLASCESGVQKSAGKIHSRTGHQQEVSKSAEEIAHAYGCKTIEEFMAMKFTYVIEKELPCLVYVESFNVNDIIPKIKESTVYVWAECEEYEGDCEGNVKYDVLPDWVGEPTSRQNECWIEGFFKYSSIHGVSGFVGLDKTQADWLVKKATESNLYRTEINSPIIIRVDQMRKSDGISIKADLVAILNEE